MTPCKERPLLCFQIPPEVLFDLQQIAINPAAAARARRSPALPRCRAKRADAGSGQKLTIFSKLDVFCRKERDVADHIIGQILPRFEFQVLSGNRFLGEAWGSGGWGCRARSCPKSIGSPTSARCSPAISWPWGLKSALSWRC